MNDSGRPADLFRRILRQTSSGMPPASPSSVFLVPTKNLSREQGVPWRPIISAQETAHFSTACACFGRVSLNYPGEGVASRILDEVPKRQATATSPPDCLLQLALSFSVPRRVLAPFQRIWTPMQTRRNAVSCMITVIAVGPNARATLSANP